jgi:prepilin-type N-terminal cleavage/methylation domain-containing protein/prepilin-type processing-associated H-X9-DG protein
MKRHNGVTLLELLLVIAIVAILMGLLLAAVQRIRESANRAACANKLKQIGLACHSYHELSQSFPPGYTAHHQTNTSVVQPGWCWAAFLLPHLEQAELHSQIDFCRSVEAPEHQAARMTIVAAFRCPSDSGDSGPVTFVDATGQPLTQAATMSYSASSGPAELDEIPGPREGVFYRNSHIGITDITDGTSNTCLIGDRASSWSVAPWAGAIQGGLLLGGPRNPMINNPAANYPAPYFPLSQVRKINDWTDEDGALDDFVSEHPGGINMLFADGSVRFLREAMDPVVFEAIGTRAGGEVVSNADY